MARKRSSETELAVSAAASAVPARRATTTRTRKKLAASAVEVPTDVVIAPAVEVQAIEVTAVSEPGYDAVAALAYSYWVARGYQGGSSEEDWLRAEQELRGLAVATA